MVDFARHRPIPPPPVPPAEPMPKGGTVEWARWNLRHTFSDDDGALIEWLCTHGSRHTRLVEYAGVCHVRKWAGWQAVLAWACIEALCDVPLDDDDIPF